MDLSFFSDYNYSYYYHDIFSFDDYYDYEISFNIKSEFNFFYIVCSILILCILCVPGNIFLLWALLRERAWKTTPDILLLQLTISDLCITVTLPFWVCYLFHGWIFMDWACEVIRAFFFLGLNSYVLILAAMTLYHYVAVVHASCLSAQSNQKFGVVVASTAIWLISAAVSIKVSVNSEVVDCGFGDITCLHGPQAFTLLVFDIYRQTGLFFLIPFIIITFSCVHMWITIKQCRINRHQQVSRLILGMIVVFFLCLVPYNIMLFIQSLMMASVLDSTVERRQAMHHAELIINTLLYSHCCLNPLFHIFGAQKFRRHLPVPCKTSSERRDGSHNLSSVAVIPAHDSTVQPTNIYICL